MLVMLQTVLFSTKTEPELGVLDKFENPTQTLK